jgi:hypothetical protein
VISPPRGDASTRSWPRTPSRLGWSMLRSPPGNCTPWRRKPPPPAGSSTSSKRGKRQRPAAATGAEPHPETAMPGENHADGVSAELTHHSSEPHIRQGS